MKKAKSIFIFPNGNIAVCDEAGQQIPELQDSWINFEVLKRLAKVIAKDNPTVEGKMPLTYDPLNDYVELYRKNPSLLEPTHD